jgi:uncharacterized protein YndB with AHSA1/START domain
MGYIREITIDAPVDAVWRAFSSPGELERWLAPKVEVEFREGGAFEASWGERGDTKGCRIVAIEPAKRLRFQWRGKHEFDDLFAPPHGPTEIEVRLVERDGATHVALEQPETRHGRDWAAYDEWMAEAWEEKLQALRRKCEGSDDSPYFRE